MQFNDEPEYRRLEQDSSNLILDADGDRAVGDYPRAAFRSLQAGRMRLLMGQLCLKALFFTAAAEDWLSAAACLIEATNEKQARVPLDFVRRLRADGKIPSSRRDILITLTHREDEVSSLADRVQAFLSDFGLGEYQLTSAHEPTLTFFLSQLKELPGYPMLHYAIFRQAAALGRGDLAIKHIEWAAAFEPENSNYIALAGYQYLALNDPLRAIALARGFLAQQENETPQVRIMLANALAFATTSHEPDREGAIMSLMPLITSDAVSTKYRLAAMALCALFHAELGNRTEGMNFLNDLESVANAAGDQPSLRIVERFKQLLPDALETKSTATEYAGPPFQFDRRNELFAASRELATA